MTEGKNINNTIPNNFGNSLKIESDKKNNDRRINHFIKHNSHHALNYNDILNIISIIKLMAKILEDIIFTYLIN